MEIRDEIKNVMVAINQHRYEAHCKFSNEWEPIWKWMGTRRITNKTNHSLSKIRYHLNVMEKNGVVISKRESNWIYWALVDMPGFVQHDYQDYIKKSRQ